MINREPPDSATVDSLARLSSLLVSCHANNDVIPLQFYMLVTLVAGAAKPEVTTFRQRSKRVSAHVSQVAAELFSPLHQLESYIPTTARV